MHGSLLPKNPAVADFLIRAAVTRRYGEFEPDQSSEQMFELARLDALADKARKVAAAAPGELDGSAPSDSAMLDGSMSRLPGRGFHHGVVSIS